MSRLLLLLAICLLSARAPAMADQSALASLGASGAEITEDAGDVVLTVPMTQAVPWKVRLADNPPRVILECNELVWSKVPDTASTSIADIRAEKTRPGWSELHMFLREPLGVETAEMQETADGQAVLTIRLAPTTATAFAQQTLDDPLKKPEGSTQSRLVVAIDPGHGGRDPGAQTDHVDEADLVLTFALKLRDALMRSGQADVILTRKEDSFVSLDGRLTKARNAKANVFLSIHADALAKDGGEASGITVYSLSQNATDRADLRLRERHGDDDILTGVDLSRSGDDVAEALLSLARQDTYPRTQALSASIVDAFMAGGLELNARPEREGDLAVLKAADIPSVLVELGFLSTDADLQRLSSDIWQENAATALGNAVLLWFEEDQMSQAFRP